MSLCASHCPAKQQASWAGTEVHFEAKWGWCLPHSGWPSQTLGLGQGPVVLSLAPCRHIVRMMTWAQHPQLLTPSSHFLPAETTGSRLTAFLSTYIPAPPSAKWPSLWRTHQNPDHTTAPGAPHSLPFPYPESAADPPSHPDPSRYPQCFSNSNTPSPPLRASLKLPYPKPFTSISLNIQAHEPTTFS